MSSRYKIKPNDSCPCWSRKKYKCCCAGKIDWPTILSSGADQVPHMSIRGRNILFVTAIAEALQLDTLEKPVPLPAFKKAFTPAAVRKIYEAIVEIWPSDTNIGCLLERTREEVSGLYIGDYQPTFLKRAVVRHSVYANKILLVDPFMHPHTIAQKFNPLVHPDEHRAQTLMNVNLIFDLLPWIDAGLVEFIRTPADFDCKLNWESMSRAQNLKDDPDLKAEFVKSWDELKERPQQKAMREMRLMGLADDALRREFKKFSRHDVDITEDEFVSYINRKRDRDRDFLEPIGIENPAQLHMWSTGGTYEIAKLSAQMSNAYLFTDLSVRWRLIERDRQKSAADTAVWSPFAKAFQNTHLNFLNNMGLDHALNLRKEQRLEGVRSVMMKAWSRTATGGAFDDARAVELANELADAVRDAEAEWDDIKLNAVKWTSAEAATGLLAAGPLILTGHAQWLAAAVVTSAAGHALSLGLERRAYLKRHPAAFFMDLKQDE